MQNPKGRVLEIAARAKLLMGFVNGRQGVAGGIQELNSNVALANRTQLFAKCRNAGFVRIEEPAFSKE